MLDLQEQIEDLANWPTDLISLRLSDNQNGNYTRWKEAVDSLPNIEVRAVSYSDTVFIDGITENKTQLIRGLKGLLPWRKGPFKIADTLIETEWQSDWKWSRVVADREIQERLKNATILDVGCGNGYFGWRMLESGAKKVVGIDPSALFCLQHQCLQRYLLDYRNVVLPLKLEELPFTNQFDCVFSMGVIYHRRDPLDHLSRLYELTSDAGLLILETLIHQGHESLIPKDRYARMGNVWRVPCEFDLFEWIEEAGYKEPTRVNITKTSPEEQRATEWMKFESLIHALDPNNPNLTVEGYQAPIREIIIAKK